MNGIKRQVAVIILMIASVSYAETSPTTLISSFGASEDFMGSSCALSEDGDIAVIGAPGVDVAGRSEQGAVYIFERNGDVWSQTVLIIARDGDTDHQFGTSVGISDSGDYIVVGSPGSDSQTGCAYVFKRVSKTVWEQEAKITYASSAKEDEFGFSVSIDGSAEAIVIGAPGAFDSAGRAYVYQKPVGGWSNLDTPSAVLQSGDGDRFHYFGDSCAFSSDGSTVVVGAPGNESAYIYQSVGNMWSDTVEDWNGKITASDGYTGLNFGTAVDVSGDGTYIVVGGPKSFYKGWYKGAGYVFQYTGMYWAQAALFMTESAPYSAEMGTDVAISDDGDVILLGAPGGDGGGVCLFEQADGKWISDYETDFLIYKGIELGDQLGYCVDLSGDGQVFMSGAPYHDEGLNDDQGFAYIKEYY